MSGDADVWEWQAQWGLEPLFYITSAVRRRTTAAG